jgi:hypothetical protein
MKEHETKGFPTGFMAQHPILFLLHLDHSVIDAPNPGAAPPAHHLSGLLPTTF